jgi:hypothetical protein
VTWEDEALCSLINAFDHLGAFRESASPYVAECALKALAPHLAARDAAVWAQACEAMRAAMLGRVGSAMWSEALIEMPAPPPPEPAP